MQIYKYKVFGLVLESEIELPELVVATDEEPQVQIILGKVPEHLPDVQASGVLYEAAPDDFLFRLDTVAAYRVEEGKKITVEPVKNVQPEEVRLFLLGTVISALLHQNGILPIHGSAITTSKGAVIFSGKSAAGKSTLAAAFELKGYPIITDDVAVCAPNDDNKFIVHPGIPSLKLWKDVLDHFEIESDLQKVRPQLQKYRKPVLEKFEPEPIPLHAIIVLHSKNSEGFTIENISGAKKFELINDNTFRVKFLDGLGKRLKHFSLATNLANHVEVYNIGRPSAPLLVNELADFIEEKLNLKQ